MSKGLTSQLRVIHDNTISPEKKRYLLRQVENVLYEHPGVEEASVLFTPGRSNREVLTAFIVTRDTWLAEDDIRNFLQQSGRLKPEELPRRYRIVPGLPKTLSGKVLKIRLIEDF